LKELLTALAFLLWIKVWSLFFDKNIDFNGFCFLFKSIEMLFMLLLLLLLLLLFLLDSGIVSETSFVFILL
jgi:hypothetical protein